MLPDEARLDLNVFTRGEGKQVKAFFSTRSDLDMLRQILHMARRVLMAGREREEEDWEKLEKKAGFRMAWVPSPSFGRTCEAEYSR